MSHTCEVCAGPHFMKSHYPIAPTVTAKLERGAWPTGFPSPWKLLCDRHRPSPEEPGMIPSWVEHTSTITFIDPVTGLKRQQWWAEPYLLLRGFESDIAALRKAGYSVIIDPAQSRWSPGQTTAVVIEATPKLKRPVKRL